MSVVCHLVATSRNEQQLVGFVERLSRDLQFMGYKLPVEPEIQQRPHDYLVVVGSIVRKDGLA